MIDIHSHIIPLVDDGAQDIDMAVAMLQKAKDSGTKSIILTPHYFRGKYMLPINDIKKKLEQMKVLAKENEIDINLYCGQEVYYTLELLEDLDSGKIGTLNDTRYMLIELNLIDFDSKVLDTLYELRIRNIVPIIAHPERYIKFQKNNEVVNYFIDEGCLFQLNAASISGFFGKETEKTAKIFLEKGLYSFIGSDAHSDRKRNTDMSRYIDKIDEINEYFLEKANENGQMLLNNELIKFEGRKIMKKKKGLFALFSRV
ncbi:MAG: tyrosine-protein phosphatase [Sarcina sp.]